MDEPTRRAWSTPELIVLVRSGPEEAVLAVCKSGGDGGVTGAPNGAWASDCTVNEAPGPWQCAICFDYKMS